ncbi:hypothetical protein JVT61DRAFT_1723 [Boletus reticuloceps]|uniref:Uncharacterized protein n=1 Tax=Boletus reticuloceps TaxID=495285 RepID=A0A8I2YJF1_9AGAM|nr:hypothetical protein JVT61DRAFT_7020 [Boletus reticuloceps]KAG6376706.1 hypothetical protein JVT61DRAFT_1723 [Boletus reticuloceps]
MLPFLFVVLLSLQWVAGDTIPRIARQHKSAASPRVLSQLLVPSSPKFALRDNGDGCSDGFHACPNFSSACAPDGSFCCSSVTNCPNNTNCFGSDQCCPQDAQTCGGLACCDAGATCCNGNTDCCDSGSFCCNDSFGGCCSDGTSCIAGSFHCSSGGSGGNPPITAPSPLPSQSSLTQSPSVPTFSPPVVGTLPSTIGGVSPTFFLPSSSSTATASATSTVPGFGGLSGSPHSISLPSMGKTAGLAAVVCMIAYSAIF